MVLARNSQGSEGHVEVGPDRSSAGTLGRACQEVGYSRVRVAEIEAVELKKSCLKPFQHTSPVTSRSDRQLTIIAGGGESQGDTSSFPWPQIQSVLGRSQAPETNATGPGDSRGRSKANHGELNALQDRGRRDCR